MKSKKLFFASAMALTLGLAPVYAFNQTETIYAADELTGDSTLTITGSKEGVPFEIYQIFKGAQKEGVSTDPNHPNRKELGNIEWGAAAEANGGAIKNALINKFFHDSENKDQITAQNVADKLAEYSDSQAKEIAQLIGNTIVQNGIQPSVESKSAGKDGSVTFNNLKSGYYFVKNGDADLEGYTKTDYMLKVVGNTQAVTKADDVPHHEKKVKENIKSVEGEPDVIPNSGENATEDKLNDVADYNIGDEVPFELGAVVPDPDVLEKYENYTFTFHDTMDPGLSIIDGTEGKYSDANSFKTSNIKVYAISSDGSKEKLLENQYEVKNITAQGFDVVIPVKTGEDTKFAGGTKFLVTFDAKLNSNAKLNETGNENKFNLEYSNNPNGEGTGKTKDDEVVVFTYTMEFDKFNNNNEALAGAEFKLYRLDGEEKQYLVVDKVLDSDGKEIAGQYRVKGWNSEGSTLIGGGADKNNYQIFGLDAGTYYLEETKVPDGYKKPADLQVTLNADTVNDQDYAGDPSEAINAGTIGIETDTDNDGEKKYGKGSVINDTGSTLPETGGMGTTMLYVTGAILAGGAAVLYVTNKRMKKEM